MWSLCLDWLHDLEKLTEESSVTEQSGLWASRGANCFGSRLLPSCHTDCHLFALRGRCGRREPPGAEAAPDSRPREAACALCGHPLPTSPSSNTRGLGSATRAVGLGSQPAHPELLQRGVRTPALGHCRALTLSPAREHSGVTLSANPLKIWPCASPITPRTQDFPRLKSVKHKRTGKKYQPRTHRKATVNKSETATKLNL